VVSTKHLGDLNTDSASKKDDRQPKISLISPPTKSLPTFVAFIVAIYLVRTNQTSVIDQEDDSAHKKKSALDKLFLSTCNKHPGTTRKKDEFFGKSKKSAQEFLFKNSRAQFYSHCHSSGIIVF